MKYLALIYEAFIGYDYPGKGLKKYVEWYKDNLYAGTATGFDLMQFVSNILIFVFLVGFAVALAFFLSQIIAVLTLLLPLVALFRYNIFDGD